MSASFEALCDAAKAAASRRDWTAALDLWQSARDRFPSRVEGYVGAGSALRDLGRLDEADKVLADAVARFPSEPEAAMHFSWTAERRRDWAETLRRWQAMQERIPGHYAAPIGAGIALMELGRLDEAEAMIAPAVERWQHHVGAALCYARIAIRRSDWTEAARRVALFSARFPNRPEKDTLAGEAEFLRRMDQIAGATPANDAPDARPAEAEANGASDGFAKILWDFENIGDNCEFAFLQREFGVEPVSLLRFAGIGVPDLIDALGQEFRGVEDPEYFRLSVSERGEYVTHDTRWKMVAHTFYQASAMSEATFNASQRRRMRYLRDRFLENLEAPEKILVYRRNERLGDDEISALFRALQRFGPNTLLCIREAEPGHPAGTVDVVEEGLMVGYISRLSPPGVSLPFGPRWQQLCQEAHRIWTAQSASRPALSAVAGM